MARMVKLGNGWYEWEVWGGGGRAKTRTCFVLGRMLKRWLEGHGAVPRKIDTFGLRETFPYDRKCGESPGSEGTVVERKEARVGLDDAVAMPEVVGRIPPPPALGLLFGLSVIVSISFLPHVKRVRVFFYMQTVYNLFAPGWSPLFPP